MKVCREHVPRCRQLKVRLQFGSPQVGVVRPTSDLVADVAAAWRGLCQAAADRVDAIGRLQYHVHRHEVQQCAHDGRLPRAARQGADHERSASPDRGHAVCRQICRYGPGVDKIHDRQHPATTLVAAVDLDAVLKNLTIHPNRPPEARRLYAGRVARVPNGTDDGPHCHRRRTAIHCAPDLSVLGRWPRSVAARLAIWSRRVCRPAARPVGSF